MGHRHLTRKSQVNVLLIGNLTRYAWLFTRTNAGSDPLLLDLDLTARSLVVAFGGTTLME